jgi:hypothetical protein
MRSSDFFQFFARFGTPLEFVIRRALFQEFCLTKALRAHSRHEQAAQTGMRFASLRASQKASARFGHGKD